MRTLGPYFGVINKPFSAIFSQTCLNGHGYISAVSLREAMASYPKLVINCASALAQAKLFVYPTPVDAPPTAEGIV